MESTLGSDAPGRPADGHRPTEINALLGRGTHFEGKLFFEGRVRIDGSFRGEIRGDDVLVIGEGAVVTGEVHVATCIVTGGEVEADIKARDAIELYAPSKVTGALHAPANVEAIPSRDAAFRVLTGRGAGEEFTVTDDNGTPAFTLGGFRYRRG